MWLWICVAIVVVGLAVHVFLGWRVWLALKGLFAQAGALERTMAGVERELSRVGATPMIDSERPRHGVEVAGRA